MPESHHIPFLTEVLTFLITAVVIVPLSRALRISPIIGFLAVGVIVGPSVLRIVTDVDGVTALAELGVIFLLFTIGLELSLDRLWQMRRYVFGLGLLQVLICGAAIGGVAYVWDNNVNASILLGLSLALSSTAVVVQLLVEREQFASRHGRTSFSILLFQDLAVVPLLFLVGVLGQGGDGSPVMDFALAMLKAVAAVAVILLLGRVLLRPLYRIVAGTRSPEIFVALTLLAILGTAYATGAAGLSMALGAFLAGLLLAETEFRHQIEADIQPFKGLLLGLFFIAIGLQIDLNVIADKWVLVLLAVFGLYGLKIVVITLLGLAARLPLLLSFRVGLLLGQGGEFAFVVITAAMATSVIVPDIGQFMLAVTALTMVLTPFAALLGERLEDWLGDRQSYRHIGASPEEFGDLDGHVIIAGYGRVGRTVARLLNSQMVPYVALDLNTQNLARFRQEKLPVFFGDSRNGDVLEQVGVAKASTLVITLDDPAAVRQTLELARHRWPDLDIYVRARDSADARDLMTGGACHAVPETVESSLQLASEVLQSLGTPAEAVAPVVEAFRDETYRNLSQPEPAE